MQAPRSSGPQELFDPSVFRRTVAPGYPLLGLDPGTKTIGVALSDIDWTLASPVTTVRRVKLRHDVDSLLSIINEEKVGGIVIGMPYNMDGSAGPRAQSVRAFRRSLAEYTQLPMLFWDERLSSAAAADTLKDAGRRPRQRQATIDAAAAAHILQECLAHLRSLTNQ